MAIVRTKRKVIVDPHGYEAGKVTKKAGKGFQSMSESYESVKQFCESAFINGYMLAQREYAEPPEDKKVIGKGKHDSIPQIPEKGGNGKKVDIDSIPADESNSASNKAKNFWKNLSKDERTALKAVGITTASALAAAGIYSLIKNHKSKADDPAVQKAYTRSFIDGYFYAQREFSEEEEKADEERRERNWQRFKNAGLAVGGAGLGTAAISSLHNRSVRNGAYKATENGGKVGRDVIDKLVKSNKRNNILTPIGSALAAGSAIGLYQAHRGRKERLEKNKE